jgi:hypothetical protein
VPSEFRSRLFEISRLLVRVDHSVGFIEDANDRPTANVSATDSGRNLSNVLHLPQRLVSRSPKRKFRGREAPTLCATTPLGLEP